MRVSISTFSWRSSSFLFFFSRASLVEFAVEAQLAEDADETTSLGDEDCDDADEIEEGSEEEVDTDEMDEEDEEDAYPFFFLLNLVSFALFLIVLPRFTEFTRTAGPVLRELTRVPNNWEFVSVFVGGGGGCEGVDGGGGCGRLDFFLGLVLRTAGGVFFLFALTFFLRFFFGSVAPTKSIGGEGKVVVL